MKAIPNFEDYLISREGKIYSTKSNKILKQRVDRYGYAKCTLFRKGKAYYRTIHRLVAITYISNPRGLPTVNHINENKLDNRVENLEWMSIRDNDNHGTRNLRISNTKCRKPVEMTLSDGRKRIFKGVKDASRQTGIAHSQITRACKGIIEKTHDKTWRYMDERD